MSTKEQIDLTYRHDGFWIKFFPVSDAGVGLYESMLMAGNEAVLTIHADAFIRALRKSGYVVRRSKEPSSKSLEWTSEDEALLSALNV